MQIKTLHLVVKPTKDSTIQDINISCNMEELILMFKGGLEPKDILYIFTDPKEAERSALRLLDIIKKANGDIQVAPI